MKYRLDFLVRLGAYILTGIAFLRRVFRRVRFVVLVFLFSARNAHNAAAIAYAHQLRDKGVSVALLYGLTAEELHQRVDSGEASAAVYLNGSVFEQYGKAVF